MNPTISKLWVYPYHNLLKNVPFNFMAAINFGSWDLPWNLVVDSLNNYKKREKLDLNN